MADGVAALHGGAQNGQIADIAVEEASRQPACFRGTREHDRLVSARNQRPLGIIMLEIDNFKELSGAAGREAADAAIREIGNLLQSVVRREDVACRFGGEKFVVLLPQGSAEVTQQRAESFRTMVKSLEVKHRNQSFGRITASLGISVFPDNGRTVDALLRATEGALHRARTEGGDRIVVAR